MNNWGVPQIVAIVIYGIDIGIALVKHGQRKEGKYSVWEQLIAAAIEIAILKAGGFF